MRYTKIEFRLSERSLVNPKVLDTIAARVADVVVGYGSRSPLKPEKVRGQVIRYGLDETNDWWLEIEGTNAVIIHRFSMPDNVKLALSVFLQYMYSK